MTDTILDIKRILNCSEEEAIAKAPGGRIERGCVDPEAASAVLELVSGVDGVAGGGENATANHFRKDGE